jgi:hypothetical protein
MPFCSFKVRSPGVLGIPGYLIGLDTGINVFNAEVPDLEAFRQELSDLGVQVLEVNRLDEHEPIQPDIRLLR